MLPYIAPLTFTRLGRSLRFQWVKTWQPVFTSCDCVHWYDKPRCSVVQCYVVLYSTLHTVVSQVSLSTSTFQILWGFPFILQTFPNLSFSASSGTLYCLTCSTGVRNVSIPKLTKSVKPFHSTLWYPFHYWFGRFFCCWRSLLCQKNGASSQDFLFKTVMILDTINFFFFIPV